jgi:O-methyltransferase involved in polyketide biosynthesis
MVMNADKILIKDFPAVSKTALMTMYCRAMDYQAKNPILKDKFSYDLYQRIDTDWKGISKNLRGHDYVLTAIRVRKYDRMCQEFINQHPKGIIVSLGAGLDYRFGRIDNGQFTFIDVEFPEVLEFKKQIIPKSSRNVLIGKSVLDYSWIGQVKQLSISLNEPVFFIAEGLIPYLEKNEIKDLFTKMIQSFPQSEFFFDVCGEKTVERMSKHSGIEDWNLKLKSGFNSGKDMEEWGIGFKLLGEWYYPEDPDAKRGLMKLMWVIPAFKSWLYFIHGQLS